MFAAKVKAKYSLNNMQLYEYLLEKKLIKCQTDYSGYCSPDERCNWQNNEALLTNFCCYICSELSKIDWSEAKA